MQSRFMVVSLALVSLLVGCNPHSETAMELSPLVNGNEVSDAAIYRPYDPGPHRILLLESSGEPHKWNSKLPEDWLPSDVSNTELVALVETESEVQLGTQKYTGGPPISRYRFEIGIQILEARTGIALWTGTVKGSEPPGFPATAPKNQTKLRGSHVSSEDLVEWLSCKVVSDNCEIRILEGSKDTLYWLSLAFSPDGQTLAAIPAMYGGKGGGVGALRGGETVTIWRLADGVLQNNFETDTSARSVAFSPDGSILSARTADGTLYLWRTDDGSLLRTMDGHEDEKPCNFRAPPMPLIFSSDGQYLTVGGCEVAELWRVSDGKLLNTIIPSGTVFDSAISLDGQFLAMRTNSKARIYQVRTGAVMPGPSFGSAGLAFSPDGQVLAVGDTRTRHPRAIVQLWQISDSILLRELLLEEVRGAVMRISIAFSPDGQLLATKQDDGGLELWRIEDGRLLRTLDEPVNSRYLTEIPEVEFSPDGQFLAFTNGSFDGTIRIWRIQEVSE